MERGLTNYWGYNTLAYFAPESAMLRRIYRKTPSTIQNDGRRSPRRWH